MAAALLSNFEADGTRWQSTTRRWTRGDDGRCGGGSGATPDEADHSKSAGLTYLSSALDFSITTSPPPAALVKLQQVKPVDEASGTQAAAQTASIKKLEIEQLWEQILVYAGLAEVGLERLKELLTFSDF